MPPVLAARRSSLFCRRTWRGAIALLMVLLVGGAAAGVLVQSAWGQAGAPEGAVVLRGTVTDAETGEALPSATLHVEGTFRGTITNAEGAFALPVEELPATVVVRYIGYETARVRVAEAGGAPLRVALRPTALEVGELVVEAGRNPAADIMRRVIARKAERRARLETYRAEAYNRFTLSNDTGIVSLVESLTQLFWDAERGTREVVKGRRATANLPLEEFLPAGLFITNLYDDDVEVGGFALIGVTHPDALEHYRFRLDSIRALDGQRVFDIAVEPRGRLKSAFRGSVAVLDSAYALVEADLSPGEAFRFPPPIDQLSITYHQQFSDFGKGFWLPLALRSRTEVKVALPGLLDVPPIRIDQTSRLAEYEVNVPLPDSLYAGERYLAVDTAAVAEGAALDRASAAAVPLSEKEAGALAAIDSTMTLDKAYAPTGLLARFLQLSVSISGEEEAANEGEGGGGGEGLVTDAGLAPQLWFDRVDALNAAVKPSVTLGERLRLSGLIGYKTGRREATYGGGGELALGPGRLFANYRYGTEKRYASRLYSRFTNSATVLAGGDDYFDYLGTERLRIGAERQLRFLRGLPYFGDEGARLRLTFTSARQFSVDRTTSYDLLGYDALQPVNPPVPEGVLRAQKLSLVLGGEDGPLGFFSAERRLALSVENGFLDRGSTSLLGGGLFFGTAAEEDLRFARFEASVDYAFETFFRRRLFPNELRLRLTGATFAGEVPPQRFGIVDAGGWFFASLGALRTLGGRPYEGERHAALFWEHDFRTVPFERAGLMALAERGWGLILHGGHGRTWISGPARARLDYEPRVPGGFHHEVGLSLSGVLGIFRLDVSQRLDAPGTAFGIGAARIF